MRQESLYLLVSWLLLSTSCVTSSYFRIPNNTCEVVCLCHVSPITWNQLRCCTESFSHRTVRNPVKDLSPVVGNSPVDGEMPMLRRVRELRSLFRKQKIYKTERKPLFREQRSPVAERRQNLSCVYPVIYIEPLLDELKKLVYNIPFRMIHDCEETFIDSDLHKKCLEFRNISRLENVIPVADAQTNTVYANRFCAECSGIQDFEEFSIKFVCGNALLGHWELLSLERTQENMERLIKSGLCVYSLQPPNEKTLKNIQNRCNAATYTECNQAEVPVVIPYWYACDSKRCFRDNYYCAFCGDTTNKLRVSGANKSENSVQTTCNASCPNIHKNVMTFSFFILVSLDRVLMTTDDDRVLEPRDQKCKNQSHVYDQYMDVCRRIFCPLFHVRKGQSCYLMNHGLKLPKLATILFHEINKTENIRDPYRNFEEDILRVVENDILWEFLWYAPLEPTLSPPWLLMQLLYMNFYQKQGINESDFILEFAWLSRENEELVPKAFARVFNTINMSIPIPHTSTLFEARSITNFITNGDNITINHVTYTRIYGTEYRYTMDTFNFGIHSGTRYLRMNRLILCNRVSLSLSELIMSNDSFYRHSGDAAVTLPEDYIITGNSIEMCVDEYLNSISYAMTSSDKDGNALDITVDIAVILSFVCSCVSIVCLLITIVTYLLFEPLRTLPGKINLCLCVSLLIAQILQQFTIDVTEYKIACIIFGALIHFTWSATLFWMSASSFNLFRCFSPSNLGRRDFKPSLGLYAIYVISMSALLVVANIGYNFLRDGSVGYGKRICYISSTIGLLITFVSPVGVIVLTNTCFLSVTIWRISHTPKPEGSKSADRNNVLIYIKMSTLTGTCWIFGFLRILTDVDVFEILFIIANASQGLFIMTSFVCNRRVLAMFKELVLGARESNN